jgi:hypothetical protein
MRGDAIVRPSGDQTGLPSMEPFGGASMRRGAALWSSGTT